MQLKVILSEEDYINYNIFANFYTSFGKRNVRNYRMMLPVALILVDIGIWLFTKDMFITSFEVIFTVIASVVWYFVCPKLLQRGVRKNIMKMKKDGELPYSKEEDLVFGDEEITGTTSREVKRVRYEDINRISMTDDYTYIWIDAGRAWIIPLHILGNRRGEFMEFLKVKAPGKIEYIN